MKDKNNTGVLKTNAKIKDKFKQMSVHYCVKSNILAIAVLESNEPQKLEKS